MANVTKAVEPIAPASSETAQFVEQIITLNAFQSADINPAIDGALKEYKVKRDDSPLKGKSFRTYTYEGGQFIVGSDSEFEKDRASGNIYSVKLKKVQYEKKLRDENGEFTDETETTIGYDFVSYTSIEKQRNLIQATKGLEFEMKEWDAKIANVGKVASSAVNEDLLKQLLSAVNRA